MAELKLCQKFLTAAAATIRRAGLARGTRLKGHGRLGDGAFGSMCMLGAMDACGVRVSWEERNRIEEHIVSLLPPRPHGDPGRDRYNPRVSGSPSHIAWWSNMLAADAEEVAKKFEQAAETC